jgi:hypothetical protein
MKKTREELLNIVTEFTASLSAIPDDVFQSKPNPKKWSKPEVLGHLIDSAQNNLRRFIVGQYATSPPNILYDQDFWVQSNDYVNAPKIETIQLWRLINEQICRVLAAMPTSNCSKTCNTGKNSEELRTLQWLAEDYVKHMKHHLNQITPGSFDITYP